MSRKLTGIEKGVRLFKENEDHAPGNSIDLLFGAGPPPGTAGETDDAQIGSVYRDTTLGGVYKKVTKTSLAADWKELADASVLTDHLDGGSSKHDATEIDYEEDDGNKINIAAGSDNLELAVTDLDQAIGDLTFAPANYGDPAADVVSDHLQNIDTAIGLALGLDLATVLANGNITDGTGIDVSTGDHITFLNPSSASQLRFVGARGTHTLGVEQTNGDLFIINLSSQSGEPHFIVRSTGIQAALAFFEMREITWGRSGSGDIVHTFDSTNVGTMTWLGSDDRFQFNQTLQIDPFTTNNNFVRHNGSGVLTSFNLFAASNSWSGVNTYNNIMNFGSIGQITVQSVAADPLFFNDWLFQFQSSFAGNARNTLVFSNPSLLDMEAFNVNSKKLQIGRGTAGQNYTLVFHGDTEDGTFTFLEASGLLTYDQAFTVSGTFTASAGVAFSAIGDGFLTISGGTVGSQATIDISADTNLAVVGPILLTDDTLSLDTIDISADTNLAVVGPILLTDDTLSLDTIDISSGTNLSVSSPITLAASDIGFDFDTNNIWGGTNQFEEDVVFTDGVTTIGYEESEHVWRHTIDPNGGTEHFVIDGTESARPASISNYFKLNIIKDWTDQTGVSGVYAMDVNIQDNRTITGGIAAFSGLFQFTYDMSGFTGGVSAEHPVGFRVNFIGQPDYQSGSTFATILALGTDGTNSSTWAPQYDSADDKTINAGIIVIGQNINVKNAGAGLGIVEYGSIIINTDFSFMGVLGGNPFGTELMNFYGLKVIPEGTLFDDCDVTTYGLFFDPGFSIAGSGSSLTHYVVWANVGDIVMNGDNLKYIMGAGQEAELFFDTNDDVILDPGSGNRVLIGATGNERLVTGEFIFPDYANVTLDSPSNGSQIEQNIFDEDEHSVAGFASTANLTAKGITFDSTDGTFNIAKAGQYPIDIIFVLATGTAQLVKLIIKVNGTPVYSEDFLIHSVTDPRGITIPLMLTLAANDDVTFFIDAQTANNVNSAPGTTVRFFQIAS